MKHDIFSFFPSPRPPSSFSFPFSLRTGVIADVKIKDPQRGQQLAGSFSWQLHRQDNSWLGPLAGSYTDRTTAGWVLWLAVTQTGQQLAGSFGWQLHRQDNSWLGPFGWPLVFVFLVAVVVGVCFSCCYRCWCLFFLLLLLLVLFFFLVAIVVGVCFSCCYSSFSGS